MVELGFSTQYHGFHFFHLNQVKLFYLWPSLMIHKAFVRHPPQMQFSFYLPFRAGSVSQACWLAFAPSLGLLGRTVLFFGSSSSCNGVRLWLPLIAGCDFQVWHRFDFRIVSLRLRYGALSLISSRGSRASTPSFSLLPSCSICPLHPLYSTWRWLVVFYLWRGCSSYRLPFLLSSLPSRPRLKCWNDQICHSIVVSLLSAN